MKFYFQDLRVYQEAKGLAKEIFKITKAWPALYKYNLADQLVRAALSISLNIAEGSSRSNKDFQHFLSIARGSCFECIPILEIAFSENIISKETHEALLQKTYDLSKMLSSLRTSLQSKATKK